MPTVFTKDGFRFFFYSNDHTPIHVRKGEAEAVFEIGGKVSLRESMGFKTRELNLAENLAEEHKTLIIQKWHEFFD